MQIATPRLDVLSDIATLQTGYDVFRLLKDVSLNAGFDSFTLFGAPSEQETLREATMLGTWQPELVAAYDSFQLAAESAVLKRAQTSPLSFCWQIQSINAQLPNGLREKAVDLFTDFNMKEGLVCPIHVPDQAPYLVEFTGSTIPRDPNVLHSIHIVALHATERLRALTRPNRLPAVKLTPRERDCLSWTAEGKTSGEIAVILAISEHTVNHYLTLAARKLESHTRPQAIAKAIRLKLIT